ncbi:MAG: hypothetical protein IJ877_06200 [Candidatus Gastranaerophilales bacterium]|nr:hypothetical protein [Candidatus Gastranaerophilales bacterium]
MKQLCVLFAFILLSACCNAQDIIIQVARNGNCAKETRYDYVYYNPPRQSLEAWGRYIYSNSRIRYVNSPSKLKRAAHAARIDANNFEYNN